MMSHYIKDLPWGDSETFNKATDEQLQIWRQECGRMDSKNDEARRTLARLYHQALQNVEMIWGKSSNEYKYLDKAAKWFPTPPQMVDKWETCSRNREEWIRKQNLDLQKQREQRERMESTSKIEREIARIAIQHGLDAQMDVSEILEVLISRTKYYPLAIALYRTRLNWSEGFHKVRSALHAFKSETDLDKEIVDELNSILSGDETDGRVFRDCTYNYSNLLSLDNPQLVQDINRLTEIYEKYY